jgi:hypothetical protein
MKHLLKPTFPTVALVTGALLGGFAIASAPGQAANYPGLYFACDNGLDGSAINDRNVLYGMYGDGTSVDLARFSGAGGYDAATRCEMISQEMNEANLNNQLKYLKTGQQNGQNIVCAVADSRQGCYSDSTVEKGYTYLFTIAYETDPAAAAAEFNRFLTRLDSSRNVGMMLQDSDSQQFYVDFEAYLQSAFNGLIDVSTGESLETNSR